VVVAVVATGAAGVKANLLRSGSSSDFRRRGDPGALRGFPDGDEGLEGLGEICVGRAGMGKRRFGWRLDRVDVAGLGDGEEGFEAG
jgi:hypothetical protein